MKKLNIFTLLMIVAVFEVALRLLDMSSFISPSAAESTPPTHELKKADTAETPVTPKKDAAAPTAAAAPAADAPAPPAAPTPTVGGAMPPPPAYGERSFSAAEVDVLQSLAKRRDELDTREQNIAKREALLKAAGGEVDRKITELNKLKSDLEALLAKQQTIQNEHIDSLVKIYEGMKPKEAARIFDTLDMDVLMSVIDKMSERKSSPIIANMDPDKARLVTIKLSEQQKLPSKPDAAPAPAPAATTPATAAPAAPAPAAQ